MSQKAYSREESGLGGGTLDLTEILDKSKVLEDLNLEMGISPKN